MSWLGGNIARLQQLHTPKHVSHDYTKWSAKYDKQRKGDTNCSVRDHSS